MNNQSIIELPLLGLVHALQTGVVSPQEAVRAFLDRIVATNSGINAVVTLREDEALKEAAAAASAIAHGRAGPLTGVPFTVKDTIETAGVRTTAGSTLFESNVPALDAPAVARLRSQGAILLAKTNTPEFAMTFATANALFGETTNPRNPGVSAGGSSGGEAAILAAGGSPLGLGSDLGGSIRVPASFCGVCGLRPTIGRLPPGGHIPILPEPFGSAAVIGPMARSADDIDTAMKHLDQTWRITTGGHHNVPLSSVGYFFSDPAIPTAPEVKQAIEVALTDLGQDTARLEEVLPPRLSELFDLWDEIWNGLGGARALLGDRITNRVEELSRPLQRLVEASPDPDLERVNKAKSRLAYLRREMLGFFERFPLLICPVAAGPATERAGSWVIEGVELRGARGFGYSYAWSLLGFAALAIPSRDSGLPGIQIVARPGRDEEAIDLAILLDRSGRDS